MSDYEKMEIVLYLFLMQGDVQKGAKKEFDTEDNSITKLFITADLMQIFMDNIEKHPAFLATVSLFKPLEKISCKIGDEGLINNVKFEIIKGKEQVYSGIEVYQSYKDEQLL